MVIGKDLAAIDVNTALTALLVEADTTADGGTGGTGHSRNTGFVSANIHAAVTVTAATNCRCVVPAGSAGKNHASLNIQIVHCALRHIVAADGTAPPVRTPNRSRDSQCLAPGGAPDCQSVIAAAAIINVIQPVVANKIQYHCAVFCRNIREEHHATSRRSAVCCIYHALLILRRNVVQNPQIVDGHIIGTKAIDKHTVFRAGSRTLRIPVDPFLYHRFHIIVVFDVVGPTGNPIVMGNVHTAQGIDTGGSIVILSGLVNIVLQRALMFTLELNNCVFRLVIDIPRENIIVKAHITQVQIKENLLVLNIIPPKGIYGLILGDGIRPVILVLIHPCHDFSIFQRKRFCRCGTTAAIYYLLADCVHNIFHTIQIGVVCRYCRGIQNAGGHGNQGGAVSGADTTAHRTS